MSDESARPALPDWWSETASALDARMGLEVTELTAERTVGSMPVEGNTQPYGLWHGGASCVLAETLASIAPSPTPGREAWRWAWTSTPPTTARSGRGG